MLNSPHDAVVGQTVYLYPQTKQASANVHRMLAVQIGKALDRHWPMVLCVWKERGTDFWEMVHRDNIRLRSPNARSKVEDKQGDTATGSTRGAKPNRVRVMPGKPIEFEGQETLF